MAGRLLAGGTLTEGNVFSGKVRAWYGLRARIAIGTNYWHHVEVGPVKLPHRAVVNLVVRRGLGAEDRDRLGFRHEEGHLQTLPLVLAHAVWGLRRSSEGWRGRRLLPVALSAILATLAAWEVTAEGYAVLTNPRQYYRAHRGRPQYGRAAFWAGMLWLALALRCSRRCLSPLPRAAIAASATSA